jgi:L-malate glycosyltransferase
VAQHLNRHYRLAVLCDSIEVGGAEQFLVHLVGGLPANVDVTIYGRDRRVVDAIAAARPTAATQILPMEYVAALRALRRFRPEVAHANLTSLTSCRALVLAALTLRIPVVLVDHLPTPGLTWKGRALQRLITQRSADRVSVGDRSARLVERYAGLRSGSVRSIRNGIPRRSVPMSVAPGPKCVFGFLGRLDPQKGVDVLIEALSLVPDATLEIMGSGGQLDALQAAAARLELSRRVRFTPGSPDTMPFWERIDVLVLPSRSEALPLVILEALQSGHPVIASDVGSIREVLDEDVAVLVPPEDVDALAEALRAVNGDRELRDRLRAAVVDRASHMWSSADMVAAYDELYWSALRRD